MASKTVLTRYRLSQENMAKLQRLAKEDRRTVPDYVSILIEDHINSRSAPGSAKTHVRAQNVPPRSTPTQSAQVPLVAKVNPDALQQIVEDDSQWEGTPVNRRP